jgi:exosome complex exonuclease RRP6
MLLYARMDTHFLLHIYDKLRELLRAGDCGGERLMRSVLSSSMEVADVC